MTVVRVVRASALSVGMVLVAGCGDKVPESEVARKLGNAPKEIIDKSVADVNQAVKQGAERSGDADAKK
jgi:hypothetical protein